MSAAGAFPSIATMRRLVATNAVPVLIGVLVATNILRLASNLVLTRLLAPEAFGVAGAVAATSVILTMLTDIGYGAFIVRSRRDIDKKFLDVIWTIRLARSVVLAGAMYFLAGPLAMAFDKPELTAPIAATALLFLVEGARSLHPVVAERQRRISYAMIVEFGVILLTTAATIVAALVLKSYWALIAGMYAGSVFGAAASYLLYPGGAHALSFDRKIARELWMFARVVAVSSVITLILGQADKIFIGRTLSLETFGLYMLAVAVVGAAQRLVQAYVGKVFFPYLAEIGRTAPQTLAAAFYDGRRRMTLFLAFLIGGLVGGGQLAIRILLDDRYLGAGIFASLLALGPLFALVTGPSEQLLIVMGRIRTALEANATRLAWITVAAPLGLHLAGTLGLVGAFALIEAAGAVYWWLRLKSVGVLKVRAEAAPFAAALLGGLIGYGFYALSEHLIRTGAIPAF